ncbi:MAG: ATP-binding protein [Aggregatilineales bacterium]
MMLRRIKFSRPQITREGMKNWTNSLWIRLIFAFAIVVMIGAMITSLISVLVLYVEEKDVDFRGEFLVEGGPVDNLKAYYESAGTWENVPSVLSGIQSIYQPNDYGIITFSFMDQTGEVVFDAHASEEEMADYRGANFDEIFDIEIEGEVVGQLRVIARYVEGVFFTVDVAGIFGEWLKESWWRLAISGGIVGLLFGILMGRTLTAPLRHLAEAAQAIGSRNLSSRVDVNGSTEVKRLATAFNQMASDLEQAEGLRRNLVADVAHELRTPLTVLQGNLRAILDDVYPLTKTEVAALYDQTRTLSRLVNDLHELSQAEARKLPLRMMPLNMTALVERIALTFSPIAEAQSIQIETQLAASLSVRGDETRIYQVLNNIVKNALNHTPDGGKITLSTWRDEGHVCISIGDTGSGIAVEHLPFVFDRFYRADRSRSRDRGGAGLGLAISKAIIEAHDGRISVQSSGVVGEGTTFTVQLPYIQQQIEKLPEPVIVNGSPSTVQG